MEEMYRRRGRVAAAVMRMVGGGFWGGGGGLPGGGSGVRGSDDWAWKSWGMGDSG